MRLAGPRDIAGSKHSKYHRHETHGSVHGLSPDVLALVRFGLRSPDDPLMVDTLRLVDEFLRVDFGDASARKRNMGDGYADSSDGEPFRPNHGTGLPWPLC